MRRSLLAFLAGSAFVGMIAYLDRAMRRQCYELVKLSEFEEPYEIPADPRLDLRRWYDDWYGADPGALARATKVG